MDNETEGDELAAIEAVESQPAADDNSDSATEQQQDADNPDNGDDAAAEKPKKKHWAHERIDELTRKRREAERERDYWKMQAEKAPTQDQFDDYDDFLVARTKHEVRTEQATSQDEAVRAYTQQTYSLREEEARERYPDYDQVARNPSTPITNDMATVIFDSDHGPDIAYHLGKYPSEAARIAQLPVHRQAAEIGKIEVMIASPKPGRNPPPPPPSTVSGAGSAGASKDPSKMSMSEYIKWRKTAE